MTNKLIKWGLIALISATPSISFAATQEANCSTAVINGGASIQFYHPGFTGQLPTDGSGYPIRGGEGGGIRVCYYSTNPTLSQTETCDTSKTETSGTTYGSIYDVATDTSCIYSYEIDSATNNSRSSATVVAAAAPQAVPIFSPFGLLALLSGLLLYGKRRSATLKK
ncbi:MAG TPA: hypothetical protein EYH20_07550 [Leucothrix sp.]|nr:hypothetical protein [Leucothrix sp.]